jgi:hypothetical protein
MADKKRKNMDTIGGKISEKSRKKTFFLGSAQS